MPPKTTPVTPAPSFGLRKKFRWLVNLQRSDGQMIENVEWESYHDPNREGAADLAMEWCAAQYSVEHGGTISGGQRQFAFRGITALLQN